MEKVRGRTVIPDGKTIGTLMILPYLTRSFMMLSFLNGEVKEYAANVIAENMLSQVDN